MRLPRQRRARQFERTFFCWLRCCRAACSYCLVYHLYLNMYRLRLVRGVLPALLRDKLLATARGCCVRMVPGVARTCTQTSRLDVPLFDVRTIPTRLRALRPTTYRVVVRMFV
jgi:hypothetical protein